MDLFCPKQLLGINISSYLLMKTVGICGVYLLKSMDEALEALKKLCDAVGNKRS